MAFNIDEYAHCFKTESNKAYFWHGVTTKNGVNYESKDTATRLAEENGGKTLEMCMLDHREELERAGVRFFDIRDENDNIIETSIKFSDNKELDKQFWDLCSQSFAEQASGKVNVVEGVDRRPCGTPEIAYKQSTWARIERDTLKNNPNVDKIQSLSAVTGREQGLIYNRADKLLAQQAKPIKPPIPSKPTPGRTFNPMKGRNYHAKK